MRNVLFAGLTCCCLAFAAGCASSGGRANVSNTTQQFGPTAPSSFARHAAAAGSDTARGAQFEPGANNCTAEGTTAQYAPAFDSAALGSAAWAVYAFNIGIGTSEDQLQLMWQTAPPVTELWIGLADQAANRWDWYQPADAALLQFTATDKYAAADGSALVAVLLLGSTPARLAALRFGHNTNPVAALTATPNSGQAPLSVTLDATGSASPSGSIVHYAWDLDADGTYEVDGGAASTHTFTLDAPRGQYNIGVEVTDAATFSATATASVTITSVLFVTPPPDGFEDNVPGDDPGDNWRGNCYKPLPEWRDLDRCFQTSWFADQADELLTLLNDARAAESLGPMAYSPHLELVAQAHARNMALNQFYSYEDQYGLWPWDRTAEVGPFTADGEMESMFSSAQPFFDALMADSMYHDLLMTPGFNYVGIGFYNNGWPRWAVTMLDSASDPEAVDWIDPDEVL